MSRDKRFPIRGMCDQQSLRPACAYAQSDHNLRYSLDYSISVKQVTEHHVEFPNLKGGCTGLAESTLVKNATLLEISCRGSIMYLIGSEWLSLLASRKIIQCHYKIGTKPLPYLYMLCNSYVWFVHLYL